MAQLTKLFVGPFASMTNSETDMNLLETGDLDVEPHWPDGLLRIVERQLVDLEPWEVMSRELALKRLRGLRSRYSRRYVPFARRQDSDDLACIDPSQPGEIFVVHDFSSEGTEQRAQFASFWDWFRVAIEDMIAFE